MFCARLSACCPVYVASTLLRTRCHGERGERQGNDPLFPLAACGLRNAEIAERLTILVGTVKNSISAILAKLDVRRRWDAAIKACGLR